MENMPLKESLICDETRELTLRQGKDEVLSGLMLV
jgi:hypothetical protein